MTEPLIITIPTEFVIQNPNTILGTLVASYLLFGFILGAVFGSYDKDMEDVSTIGVALISVVVWPFLTIEIVGDYRKKQEKVRELENEEGETEE